MRVVGEANKYVTDQAPFKLKAESERERLGTVLHVLAQAVNDCNTLLSPFLPHSCQRACTRCSVARASSRRCPRIEEVDDLDDAAPRPLPGHHRRLQPTPSLAVAAGRPGTPMAKPTPVFTKLDPSVVDDELGRLAGDVEPEPAG